ncbi:hypothetical protein V6N13_116864 [Hibiscus sabdariffa]
MVGRRARKSMSGAADDSTTKFPISGKVSLEWLMHRLASPSPGHTQSVGVFVTPDNVTPNTGSPCVATVQLGGVSRPSNVRASARLMSQWHPSRIRDQKPSRIRDQKPSLTDDSKRTLPLTVAFTM